MTTGKNPRDPKTPTTGISGRESVFDKRLREFRNTGQFEKPDLKSMQFLGKKSQEFETPSMDSRLQHSASDDEMNELEKRAFLDESSGLLNSRTIISKVALEMRRCARYKREFSLLAVELDRTGQLEGLMPMAQELAFISFCKLVGKGVREVDYIGRFDDKCLLILCPETNSADALKESERLRNIIALASPKQLGQHINLTISIGIASYPETGTAPVEVLGAALEAVQNAIAQGGNTVCTTVATVVANASAASALEAARASDLSEDFSPEFNAEPDKEIAAPDKSASEIGAVFPTLETNPVIN